MTIHSWKPFHTLHFSEPFDQKFVLWTLTNTDTMPATTAVNNTLFYNAQKTVLKFKIYCLKWPHFIPARILYAQFPDISYKFRIKSPPPLMWLEEGTFVARLVVLLSAVTSFAPSTRVEIKMGIGKAFSPSSWWKQGREWGTTRFPPPIPVEGKEGDSRLCRSPSW